MADDDETTARFIVSCAVVIFDGFRLLFASMATRLGAEPGMVALAAELDGSGKALAGMVDRLKPHAPGLPPEAQEGTS
jgi:hypothetical protein